MHQTQWSPERPLPPPVSLASQSHREKPPEVTCTSRGKIEFFSTLQSSEEFREREPELVLLFMVLDRVEIKALC